MRGGRRPGAGRPRSDERRQPIHVYVTSETKRRLKDIRSSGVSVGERFDDFVEKIWSEMNND